MSAKCQKQTSALTLPSADSYSAMSSPRFGFVNDRIGESANPPRLFIHIGGYTSLFGSRGRRLQRPLTTITLGSDSNRSVG